MGLWVDRCVRGGGLGGFRDGGCGCCLVHLVGVGLVEIFFFFFLWVVVVVMCSEYIILL